MPRLAPLIVLALLLAPAHPRATADGPDFHRVSGLAEGEHLPLRAGPGAEHAEIARLRAGRDGLIGFGCIGGLDLASWQRADAAERAAARAARWCRIGADARIGWAQGMHLGEGSDTGSWAGGPHRQDLAGSEWGLRDLGTVPVPGASQAWIRFEADGRVTGHSGCNRFRGGFASVPGRLRLGPVAMTRMACPDPLMETERRFAAVLEAVESAAATERLLALFDADGVLRATLVRRDAD